MTADKTPSMNPRSDFYLVLSEITGHYMLQHSAQRAYILATIRHETAQRWRPIVEFHPRFDPRRPDESNENFNLRREREVFEYFEQKYGPQTAIGKHLGNTLPGDGYKFRGRGFIQITGRDNYLRLGNRFGVPLVEKPDLALGWELAIAICVAGMMEGLFTGRKLTDYLGPKKSLDFRNARKTVNGMDSAESIAKHAAEYYGLFADLERLVR